MGWLPKELWEIMDARLEAADEAFALTQDMIDNDYPDYLVKASSAAWDRVEKLREAWNVAWEEHLSAKDVGDDS